MKKSFVKICFVSVFLLIFQSCSNYQNNLESVLARSVQDPTDFTLYADGFSESGKIKLTWAFDEKCDFVNLYKAECFDGESEMLFEKIYAGSECEFVDCDVEKGNFYKYYITKVRGDKTFQGNKFAFAVALENPIAFSDCGFSKSCAIDLQYKKNGVCYFYKFDSESELKNQCWYSVKIPAMKKAEIKIDEASDNSFQYLKENSTIPVNLINKQTFFLENNSYDEKIVYFVIQANPDSFCESSFGGDLRTFKIELTRILAL